jgi:hypothetical protein
MKNKKKILKVIIRHIFDEHAWTDDIGKYRDNPEPGAIIVRTGEFYGKFLQRARLIEQIENQISDLDSCLDNPEMSNESLVKRMDQLQTRRSRLESSGELELPQRGRDYRFFIPCAGGEKWPSGEFKKYALQDFKRMEELNKGYWYFIGIRAEASIQLVGDLTQKITSGGLWGINSDAGEEYFTEVEGEQRNELRDELKAIGFTERQITKAFINCEREEK